MGKAEDLTGCIFGDGMIKVLRRAENKNDRNSRWVCQCECGNTFIEYGLNLKARKRKSCGCLRKNEMSEIEMRQPAESLHYLQQNSGDPWQNLANAIVAVAADDYREALKVGNHKAMKKLDKFFHSDWYHTLTNIDGDVLLRLLHRENANKLDVIYV